MEYLMYARENMDKFLKDCTPGSLGCDRLPDTFEVVPPTVPN